MKKFLTFLLSFALLFLSALVFAGNISENKLNQLSLGMKADQIVSILGEPDSRRAEGMNAQGKAVERLRYNITRRLKEPTDEGQLEATYTCSLMIADGALVRIDRER